MFGFKLESDKFFQQVVELISRLDETDLLTFAIGVVCMAALFVIRRVNRKLPGPLIVVVVAIIASVRVGVGGQGGGRSRCGAGRTAKDDDPHGHGVRIFLRCCRPP